MLVTNGSNARSMAFKTWFVQMPASSWIEDNWFFTHQWFVKGGFSIYENLLKGKQREKITFELPLSPMLMYSPIKGVSFLARTNRFPQVFPRRTSPFGRITFRLLAKTNLCFLPHFANSLALHFGVSPILLETPKQLDQFSPDRSHENPPKSLIYPGQASATTNLEYLILLPSSSVTVFLFRSISSTACSMYWANAKRISCSWGAWSSCWGELPDLLD